MSNDCFCGLRQCSIGYNTLDCNHQDVSRPSERCQENFTLLSSRFYWFFDFASCLVIGGQVFSCSKLASMASSNSGIYQ